ncbi:MAG: ChuX/HutX family heme-like substrate-binding protein [Thiomicrospira sp.]|jgi:putative hemin transport protein|nr:ChuX/HutX family heme-like substrate-binding protein [Thiomicrospira sp.]
MVEQVNATQQAIIALRAEKQRLLAQGGRARDLAKQLAISEAEYVALGGEDPVRAVNQEDFGALLLSLVELGEVMALTRNDAMVLEHHGLYRFEQTQGRLWRLHQANWSLVLDLSAWQIGFCVSEAGRLSVQFFDASGEAVHKIYCTDNTDSQKWAAMVAKFSHPLTSSDWPQVTPRVLGAIPHQAALLDVDALRLDWRLLAHQDNIDSLLARYKVTPPQAFRHLHDGVMQMARESLQALLEAVSAQALAVEMEVCNAGVCQRHQGVVQRLLTTGPWFNVLDDGVNLHARLADIETAWLINKPFERGQALILACFDRYHRPIISVKPYPASAYVEHNGNPWYALVANLPALNKRVA